MGASPPVTAGVPSAVTVARSRRRVPLADSGTTHGEPALKTLRDRILPATLGRVDGIDYAVGREDRLRPRLRRAWWHRSHSVTPSSWSWRSSCSGGVPFGGDPGVSIALNLLSIGAAYGVVTWVFQDGHLGSALGFTPYGGVVGWQPLFMFVILFGLSMDYHIFILSRVRERWTTGATAATRSSAASPAAPASSPAPPSS